MADRLRALTEKHDRENARRHRLTGEPVLPKAPVDAGTTIRCVQCFGSYVGSDLRTSCPTCGGELFEVAG